MSHYEERLAADVEDIRRRVAEVGTRVEEAQKAAIHALLTGDRALAYETILGDHQINRDVREIDRLCHAFVARHLPSAGHLRFVSSVLRLDVELERIGDYASTICRESVQLEKMPSPAMVRDIELMADQSRRVLAQAMQAWNEANAELARGTLGMALQAAVAAEKIFADLLREGRNGERTQAELFPLFLVLNRLSRVIAQSKNICEETIFAVTGETKAPKVYRILFIDEKNDGASQLAAAHASKAFPESGQYESAGWAPADRLEPRCTVFMDRRGLDSTGLEPKGLETFHEELAAFHVIVSLGGDPRPHVPEIPYHTVLLEWDVGPGLEGLDQERAEGLLEETHRQIAARVRDLMEALRGEGAA